MLDSFVLMRATLALTIAGALVISGCHSPDRQTGTTPDSSGVAPAKAGARGPTPTFNKDIAPILFERCAPCHRPRQAAPFALLEYKEVRERAEKIVRMTKARRMPPWLPEAGFGEFVGMVAHRVVDAPDFHDGDDGAGRRAVGDGQIGAHVAVAQLHGDVPGFHRVTAT